MPDEIAKPQNLSAEQWKTAFDAVEDLISIQDADCNILMVNKAFANAFGKRPEEIVGNKCYNLLHGDGKIPANCPGKQTIEFGVGSTEGLYSDTLNKDLRVMTSPIKDGRGKLIGIVHIAHDISDLNKARAALEESEERYKAIVANIQGGIIIGDKNGETVFINDKVREIVGYSAEEMALIPRMDFIAPEEKPRMGQMMAGWGRSGASFMETDCWVVRKDGERRFLRVRASRLDNQGMSLLVLNDLTEMREAQAKIEKLYAEEKALRDELQKEIARRIQYTHTLVHEIKTPLTPVLASSELLAERLTEQPWKDLAQNIYKGAVILDRRIGELLDLANIEVGSMKLVPTLLDLRKTVSGVVSMVKSRLDANNQRISVRMPKKPVLVIGDDDRLYQVLLNLVNNACKYSDSGTEIVINLKTSGKEAILTVADEGHGISAEASKHIFEPYFRENYEHPDGLGLGLPLARQIIEMLGGKIWVESRPGEGTTIGFSLLLAE